MIGYILLVSLAVVMGGIIYAWAKTQIPQDGIGCDDGISLFVKEVTCENNGSFSFLNLTLRNNGRFSFGGFFLYGANDSEIKVATIDLTGNISVGTYILDDNYFWLQPGVKFPGETNSFDPGDENFINFSIPTSAINEIKVIEIIPMRWQKIEERERILTCGNAKDREIIICS